MRPEGVWETDPTPPNAPTDASIRRCSLALHTDGEACLVREGSPGGAGPTLEGVALVIDERLVVARGVVMGEAELGGSVGLVCYDTRMPGRMPALWYHPSLRGRVSEGLSDHGPVGGLVGEYTADYADAAGTAFEPLRKTIQGIGADGYLMSWWTESRFHYLGVGLGWEGHLAAAWGPPGSVIEIGVYECAADDTDAIVGRWADYGRARRGRETLRRRDAR